MNYRLNRLRKRRDPVVRIRHWFRKHQSLTGLIVAAIAFLLLGLISEDDYQRAKEQERLVASFWAGDGDKRFSGSGE